MLSRTSALLLLASCLFSASTAFADQCADTDVVGTNQGRNFEVRGLVEVRSDAGQVTQTKSDRCDSAGINLTEYFCSGTTVASATMRCLNGCLDGACSTPGSYNEGCFTVILLRIAPPNGTAPAAISLTGAKRSIGSLWLEMTRATQATDASLEVVLRDSSGKAFKTLYADVRPEVFDLPYSKERRNLVSRLVLPFDPAVRSITFKLGTSTLSYTLPTQLLQCGRPCVAVGGAGEDPNYDCCSGLKKRYINETGFVCEAAPPPMYTPNATPRAG